MSMIFGASAEEMESMTSLHQNSRADTTQADTDEFTDLLFTVLVAAAFIGTYQTCIFNILKTIFHQSYGTHRKDFRKIAYQITNLTVNAFLGIYGLYHYAFSVPPINSVPITDRIAGFPEFSTFGALQVGYNVWALPIGFFFMNEAPAMMAHHCAVICVGSISCFCGNGFRYHAPFFFGAIEISSVPLAIMNFCKDNKALTDRHCPKVARVVKPVFAFIFLIVRVILWTPLIADVLRISGLLGMACDTVGCRVGIGSFWLSAFFLTLLQFYWAFAIVQAIIKIIKGDDGRDKKKEKAA